MDSLLAYVLRSGASLALLYGFFWLFLRKETSFVLNRFYLLGAALFSLLVPLLRVTSPFLTTVVVPSRFSPEAVPATIAASPVPGPPALTTVLLVAYLAGAAIFSLRFLLRLAGFVRMARRCGCRRHRGLRVVFCRHRGEPFSFFHFIFLDRTRAHDADLERILAHEMVHVRQVHSLDIVLSEILTVLQWFNPFVWPYKSSLRETHEYLADRAVIAQGCSPARYRLLIVEQHVGGELLDIASRFRTSQIKRRLMMLSKSETKGLARWKPLWIVPLAAVLVLAFAAPRIVVQAAPAQETDKAKPDVGKPVSEEEMIKALKEKFAKLEEMKKENESTLAKLKDKLGSTSDPEVQAKIKALIKEEKLKSLEIGAKSRMLSMKKLEIAINRESDPAKVAEMKQKLEQMKLESDEYAKKLEQVKKAEAAAEKEKK